MQGTGTGGAPSLPSNAELKLLRELWRGGEATARRLHQRVHSDWPVGPTTVLKLLQRMHEKGLVRRHAAGRAHRYVAAVEEEALERRLALDFTNRTFEGSLSRLIQRALPAAAADAQELNEIRRLIDGLED